jgi:hypothetical protein
MSNFPYEYDVELRWSYRCRIQSEVPMTAGELGVTAYSRAGDCFRPEDVAVGEVSCVRLPPRTET